MFGLKKRDKNVAQADSGTHRLYLFLSDLGWQAHIVDPTDPERQDIRHGDVKGLTQTGEARYEAITRLAMEALPSRDQKAVGSVHLLLDDPSTIYSDTRAPLFTAASVATLRDYGAQQMNGAKVTYGQAPFGVSASGVRDNGVIAFFDTKRVGLYLTRLERLALKVRGVTPVADLLVRRAMTRGEPYAGLYIGGHYSHLVLANPLFGTVVARVLPFGLLGLAGKLAEGNGISLDEALSSLGARDLLSDIRVTSAPRAEDALMLSDSERILGPMLRRFATEVTATLEFFQNQRMSGRPAVIEVFGDVERVKGMPELLRQQLAVPGDLQSLSLLDVFQAQFHAAGPTGGGSGAALNLLQHAGAELRIGSMVYGFRDERITPASVINRDEAASRSELARQQAGSKGGGRNRKGKGRRGGQPDTPAAGGMTVSGLIARLRGEKPPEAVLPEGDAAAARQKEERQIFLLIVLVVGGLLYLGYQQVESVATSRTAAVGSFGGKLASIADSRKALGADQQQGKGTEGNDKVLWTEKFLLLSKAMNEKMWLTDLYLTSENRTVNGVNVETKKLVMEGAVLPSTDGHILEIARYIHTLQTIDNGAFMHDFRLIAFQGATIDQTSRDSIIRFGIEAWYDSNKRSEMQRMQAREGGLTASDAANQANQRNHEQDRIIRETTGR